MDTNILGCSSLLCKAEQYLYNLDVCFAARMTVIVDFLGSGCVIQMKHRDPPYLLGLK